MRRKVESLPVYPGAVRKAALHSSWPDAIPGEGVLYAIDATPGEILEFYERRLLEEGWTVELAYGPSGLEEQGGLVFYSTQFSCRIAISGRARPYDVSVMVGEQ